MNTATAATPLTALSVECSPTHQAIITARKRLNDAVTDWDKSTDATAPPPAQEPTLRLIEAAREFLHAAGPLIEHLPAITAALGDAIDYRHDDGGACRDCQDAAVLEAISG